MAHWLHRLLNPQSIAIVGASERHGSLGASTQRQLLDSGYRGDIFPVNPKYPSLCGQTCYPDLVLILYFIERQKTEGKRHNTTIQ